DRDAVDAGAGVGRRRAVRDERTVRTLRLSRAQVSRLLQPSPTNGRCLDGLTEDRVGHEGYRIPEVPSGTHPRTIHITKDLERIDAVMTRIILGPNTPEGFRRDPDGVLSFG